ncbi:SAM-dependent methyltransferase RsmB/NOP2-type [Dillenia turbinata]|uniref:SAM-dependent methyltransferase RsmB/NOP2-type n=1 Tax=Dillenia turbinata TaxID=194707 RepID=A0AAN8UHI7_9MAGN
MVSSKAARKISESANPSTAAAVGKEKGGGRRLSNAERSAYFARREAAKVLRTVLQGDASRRAVGSIKSLVYNPSIRNKKATFALLCQTLKYLPVIKDVLDTAKILNSKWKVKNNMLCFTMSSKLHVKQLHCRRQEELMYIITYDILFSEFISLAGAAEEFLFSRKNALQTALARILVKKKVRRVEDLAELHQTPDISKPRYVRVNTLKLDVESALQELGKQYTVQKDDLLPGLLVLPPGIDMHNHPLVTSGSVFLQGKLSSMVAAALSPEPGWVVLDACSAPGNKTVHLAALMRGKGKIIACEHNKERVKCLQNTIRLSGAANVEVLHGDFLYLDAKHPSYSKVRAILLDPSCSGSGTSADRLDYLLPSSTTGKTSDSTESDRLKRLAAFQGKALAHALSFPAVERVVYSTCSIHQIENEDVVKSALPLATSNGFRLATPFPQWPRRGLPVFEGGFFIALFVRESTINTSEMPVQEGRENSKASVVKVTTTAKRRKNPGRLQRRFSFRTPLLTTRMSKLCLHSHLNSHFHKLGTSRDHE